MRVSRRISHALFPLALASAAAAPSVRWENEDVTFNARVNLVFADCEPEGTPTLPEVPGVMLVASGQTTLVRTEGGRSIKDQRLVYTVYGAKPYTPVELPAFWAKTTRGEQPVAAFTARLEPSLSSAAKSHLRPARASVWAGEVFALDYELIVARRHNPQIAPTFAWQAAPLLIEDWSKPDVSEEKNADERRMKVAFNTRALAPSPAKLKFEPASHLMSVQTGSIGAGSGNQPRLEQIAIVSDQPELEVRALPAPPEGFTGAVGQFTITTKVAPLTAAVGEIVTWTHEVQGTGNWPALNALPGREVSTDFETVQPRPKWQPASGKSFEGSVAEDVVLVPTKTGTYELPGATFTYFDPATGAYQTSTAPGATLTITAAPPSAPPPYTGARKGPAAAALQKVGGATFRNPAADSAHPALSQPEQQLQRIQSQDSPSRLYQLMRTDNPSAPKNGKN